MVRDACLHAPTLVNGRGRAGGGRTDAGDRDHPQGRVAGRHPWAHFPRMQEIDFIEISKNGGDIILDKPRRHGSFPMPIRSRVGIRV